MLNIYCVTTENCNLRCSHCYMSAGPKKKDTAVTCKDFEKMLSHLPIVPTELALTGGEIFTMPDRLEQYLDLLNLENAKRKEKQKIKIELQTNGFWLKKKNARKTLERLREKNVTKLDITSNDDYHKQQGLALESELIDLTRQYFESVIFRGSHSAVMNIGRAKKLPKARYHTFEDCRDAIKNEGDIAIRNNGGVYPCCFPFFRYDGNIFDEPLIVILKRARESPRFGALSREGLRGIALYDGFNKKKIDRLIEEYGNCGACGQLYGSEEQ